MRSILRRPSPAMVVAFIALLLALTGTATALRGTNSVFKDDIAPNSVGKSEIRTGSVGKTEAARDSVGKLELREEGEVDGGLTGAHIVESSLATVPRASRATSANSASSANSLSSQRKLNYRAPQATGPVPIFAAGGLTLRASCGGGGVLTVTATTSVDNAALQSWGTTSADINDDNFLTSETHTLSADDEERGTVYHTPGGTVIAIQFAAAEGSPYGVANQCVVRGVAEIR
jgi:hypothetical protein